LIAGGVGLGATTATDEDDDTNGEQGGNDECSGCDDSAVLHVRFSNVRATGLVTM